MSSDASTEEFADRAAAGGAVTYDPSLPFEEVIINGVAAINGVVRQSIAGAENAEVDQYGTIISQSYAYPMYYTAEEMIRRDAAAYTASVRVRRQRNITAQRPSANINLVMIAGQSEECGYQAAPAITLSQPFDSVMLGDAPRPLSVAGYGNNRGLYEPIGNSNLNPAISVNQNIFGLVSVRQGGFKSVSGVTFTTVNGGGTINFSSSTATMWLPSADDGTLVSTAVGASGEPTFDLTQAFNVGDFINFYDDTETTLFSALNPFQYLVVAITATSLSVKPQLRGVPTSIANGISIYVSNAINIGEESGVSIVNAWRNLQLNDRQLSTAADPRKLAIMNGSFGGVSIQQWQKEFSTSAAGFSPSFYYRYPGGATQLAASATAESLTSCITAIVMLEGGGDLTSTGEVYGALQDSFATDLQLDLKNCFAGQTKQPAFFMFQLGGSNTSDHDNNGIVMQMLRFGTTNKPNQDCYTIGGSYFVTDLSNGYSPHWLPNGEAWSGEMAAKVINKVLCDGEGWAPLHWTECNIRGRQVLLTFHVPEPPIQFLPVFNGAIATQFTDRGFTLTDSLGAVPVAAVFLPQLNNDQTAQCLIKVMLGRDVVGQLRVSLGNRAQHLGTTNVFDSCPAISFSVYRWTAFNGQLPEENFPDMIGHPYPLFNAACIQNDLATPD